MRIQQQGPQPNWKILLPQVSDCSIVSSNKNDNLRGPDEDAADGDVSKGSDGLASDGGLDTAVDSDNVHDDTHGSAGVQERQTTADGVGNEEQEEDNADGLDNTVDTGGKEAGLGTRHAQVSEDLGSVVVL